MSLNFLTLIRSINIATDSCSALDADERESNSLTSVRNLHAALDLNKIRRNSFRAVTRGSDDRCVQERVESAVLATLSAGPGELDLRRRSLKWFHLSATGSRRRIRRRYKSQWKRTRSPRDARLPKIFHLPDKNCPSPATLVRLLRLSYSPGPVTADRRPRQEFELIFGADVRNYRQSCRPLVHAARPSVALLLLLLLVLLLLLLLLPRVETRPARKQMSDDHLVHSGHNGNDDLKPSRLPSRRPGYWITGRYTTPPHACMRVHPI